MGLVLGPAPRHHAHPPDRLLTRPGVPLAGARSATRPPDARSTTPSASAARSRPTPTRRSTRRRSRELLDLAVHAPNHHRTEPWRFTVLGPETIDRLAEATGDPQAAALAHGDRRDAGRRPRSRHRARGLRRVRVRDLRGHAGAPARAGSRRTGGRPGRCTIRPPRRCSASPRTPVRSASCTSVGRPSRGPRRRPGPLTPTRRGSRKLRRVPTRPGAPMEAAEQPAPDRSHGLHLQERPPYRRPVVGAGDVPLARARATSADSPRCPSPTRPPTPRRRC